MTAVVPDGRYRAFGYDLSVVDGVDGEREVLLSDDVRRFIESVEVEQVWDGADQITINCRAWDEIAADYAIIGEKILAPGREVVLRAGYGSRRFAMGRFRIVEHSPSITNEGPMVRIVGHCGLARLQDHQWPGHYGTLPTWTDVVRVVAMRYGFGLVADLSSPIPHRVKGKTRRVRGAADQTGKIAKVRGVTTTLVAKKAGDTDLKFLKTISDKTGFLWPKVRYIVPGSDAQWLLSAVAVAATGKEGYAIVEGVPGREVLFFERPSLRRQAFGQGDLRFEMRGPAATLTSFTPTWSISGKPQAVRVTGVTPDGKNLLRVTANIVDPALIREGKVGQIAITEKAERRLDKQRDKDFKNPAHVVMEVLGESQKRAVERDFRTGRKVETLSTEVLKTMVVARSAEDLRKLAEGWLRARLSAMTTAEATAQDIPGLETVYPNQFHRFGGLPAEYNGPYLVREVSHSMDAEGHRVTMRLQKVGEVPPSITSETDAP